MRNAAELRRDADATGWWNGPQLVYVGDGFTVPWEVALLVDLPLGFTFWLYKQYLDARWLEASRLHDWCYTPYGSLINVTREEADSALREEIAVDSIVNAEIVYRAVRFGGAQYFGTSQTGLRGWPSRNSAPNMPVARTLAPGVIGMAIKVVIVFQQATQLGNAAPDIGYAPAQRVGGWTEHVWGDADLALTMSRLQDPARADGWPPLLPARATILSTNANILGVRLYQGGAGRGQFVPMAYPGSGGPEDIPQMALLCAAQNPSSNSVRRWTIRGIPDAQISQGEFSPTTFYAGAVKQYFQSLNNFYYKGQAVVTAYNVFSVSAGGIVTLTVPMPFALNNIITLKNVLDANGIRRGGQFMVSSLAPGGNAFTITGWTFGDSTKGSAYIAAGGTFNIGGGNAPSVERTVTRKVGRPFAGYRGRRSKRRRKV